MAEDTEKRGPIEKGESGWPINPLGVIALIIFGIIAIFLIAKPLITQKSSNGVQQQVSQGGQIKAPAAGEIVRGDTLTIELSVDDSENTDKVEFWAKSYSDNKWEMVGETKTAPYKIDWQIPSNFQNKAIALTTHINTKDGKVIKDPGGWREGVILLSQ